MNELTQQPMETAQSMIRELVDLLGQVFNPPVPSITLRPRYYAARP